MKTMTIAMLLALSSTLCACGDEASETEEQARALERLRDTCPMQLAGAGVEYEETDDAVVLTFTAEPDDVPELQRRVRAMADMYESRAHHGEMHWRDMQEHHRAMHGEQAMPHGPMPPVHARAEAGEGGARLVLTPADGADLDDIREHALAHHQRFRDGQCWTARG